MKYIFLLISLFFTKIAYCQNIIPDSLYLNYPAESFEFKNNSIRHWNDGKTMTGTYTLENINGINFINIRWENNQTEKYLILINNNLCFLYKNNGFPFFSGFRITNAAPGEFCFNVHDNNQINISATSQLTEGNTIYSTNNLNSRIGICWAEGVNSNGINETLSFRSDIDYINTLHISIGFISFDKPYLYSENSRPSRIEISVENKYSIIVNLDDTPNFQTIRLPEGLERNEILRIKILNVYEGTKYEDTCISILLIDAGVY